jgi:predicted dehydrogenase
MTSLEKLRIAVIGMGRMGSAYAQIAAQHPLAELVALVGNNAEGVEKTRRAFAGVPVIAGGDLDRLWTVPGGLHGAIVATPEWAHVRPALAVLERGLHLLVEKPLADNALDGAAIAEAAKRSRGVAMVCHSVRFDPRYARARAEVGRGAIGRVLQMTARRDADSKAYARIAGRTDPAFWLAPHDIDVMQWIAESPVVAVRGKVDRDGRGQPQGLEITLRFASGASGTFESQWGAPPEKARARNCFLSIRGDAGTIEVDTSVQGLAVQRAGARLEMPDVLYRNEIDGVIGGVDAAVIDHFLRVAAQGKPPLCSVEDGLSAIRVAAAASQAAATGREIAIGKEAA